MREIVKFLGRCAYNMETKVIKDEEEKTATIQDVDGG
jgi:hypothetical protein